MPAPEETEGITMRNLVVARWIGMVGVVMVLSGCTGGSAPADVDPGTGIDPSAADSPLSVSVSPSTDLVGDGPVLTVDALPFAEASEAELPAPRRQALQQALDDT